MLAFLGFAGDGFKREEQVLLRPGQQSTVGRFTVRHNSVDVTDDGQKQMITGHVTLFEGGKQIDTLYPAKWFFRKHEEEPTSKVALRRTLAEDVYIVLPAFDLQTQQASLQIVVNPLVDWIWFGFAVIAIGTGIALLPERAYSVRAGEAAVGGRAAAATTLPCCCSRCSTGGDAFARSTSRARRTCPVIARSPLEKSMQRKLICMCRTCGRESLAECTCSKSRRTCARSWRAS